ncbi:MAG: hypothetical protein LBR83_08005 [Clostridiales bacterium]|jgi:hypothetical protein|nr:hypothetical protein [Clostridiales bacterium]
MKREHHFTRRLFIAYSSVVFILVLILFIGVFSIVFHDAVQKEVGAQQEFVLKTQQQIDTSLQNMDRIVNGLLYNRTFTRIMYGGLNDSSFARDSNEILDIMVSLDAPLFLSHRIIAFTPDAPDSYFTFTKTGDDHAHIQNAVAGYEYYERIVSADGDKVILPARGT